MRRGPASHDLTLFGEEREGNAALNGGDNISLEYYGKRIVCPSSSRHLTMPPLPQASSRRSSEALAPSFEICHLLCQSQRRKRSRCDTPLQSIRSWCPSHSAATCCLRCDDRVALPFRLNASLGAGARHRSSLKGAIWAASPCCAVCVKFQWLEKGRGRRKESGCRRTLGRRRGARTAWDMTVWHVGLHQSRCSHFLSHREREESGELRT